MNSLTDLALSSFPLGTPLQEVPTPLLLDRLIGGDSVACSAYALT